MKLGFISTLRYRSGSRSINNKSWRGKAPPAEIEKQKKLG